MRLYLNANGYADTPIWITELSIHVGYHSYDLVGLNPLKITPVEPYYWHYMSDYLNSIMDWLRANAEENRIERWFFYRTWKDIMDVAADGYMGIILFDRPEQGQPLNCLGEAYRAQALQYLPDPPPKLACDASGNTVPLTGG